jgi:hypothetical protein
MRSKAEQRQELAEELRKRRLSHHRFRAKPAGYGVGCLFCGRGQDEHEDEPPGQEEAGDVGESVGEGGGAPAGGGGDAGGGAGGP